jgi:hypothetical protein
MVAFLVSITKYSNLKKGGGGGELGNQSLLI